MGAEINRCQGGGVWIRQGRIALGLLVATVGLLVAAHTRPVEPEKPVARGDRRMGVGLPKTSSEGPALRGSGDAPSPRSGPVDRGPLANAIGTQVRLPSGTFEGPADTQAIVMNGCATCVMCAKRIASRYLALHGDAQTAPFTTGVRRTLSCLPSSRARAMCRCLTWA
jgi:hypothetical protein